MLFAQIIVNGVLVGGLYGLMAQWHLTPDSFSWEAAAGSLVGTPPRSRAGRSTATRRPAASAGSAAPNAPDSHVHL